MPKAPEEGGAHELLEGRRGEEDVPSAGRVGETCHGRATGPGAGISTSHRTSEGERERHRAEAGSPTTSAISQPAALFSMTRFGALAAATSRPAAFWHSRAVHEARDAAVARDEAAHHEALRKEQAAVATLRDKCAQSAGAAQQRAALERALHEREARLAALPPTMDKARAREQFDNALAVARALSELAEAVTVRENLVVVHRRGALRGT